MTHVRVIVTETGAGVEVARVIHGPRKKSVEQRTREQLRGIIERVLDENPRTSCVDMAEALHRGYWWTDLGSEEFTVIVLEPEQVEQLEPLKVEITVEDGLISDVKAPHGVQVIVRDYDTDGADESKLQRDNDGRRCVVATWEGGAP